MAGRKRATGWSGLFARSAKTWSRLALKAGKQATKAGRQATKTAVKAAAKTAVQPAQERLRPPKGAGDWIAGLAVGPAGARRYHLHRPPGVAADERLPMLVMLHGCGQDAKSFATSTRMNALAARERCLVLYPEQDRLANAQGCWNWFETRTGRAQAEVSLILAAIDQACLLYRADRERVAICGLSAGAGMAALVALRHPERFQAVVMHSGVGPGVAHSSASAIAAMQGLRRAGLAPGDAARALPPLLVIHGTLDRVVAPSNARAAAAAWARADGPAGMRVRESVERRVQRGKRHPMRVVDYRRGARIVATLVEIEGLGHAWSGGAAGQSFSDARGPDVSRLAWTFAAKRFAPTALPHRR